MADDSLPVRERRDWTARTRGPAMDALRYTKFVSRMKRTLSISAFSVIFAVLAFFFVERAPRQLSLTYEQMGSIKNDRAMIKPRLSGTDAQGNPFVITADAMVQDPANPKRATLQTVEADLTARQGWFNAHAKKAFVDMDAGKLQLSGGLETFSDSGYHLSTPSAEVDLKTNVATGDAHVTGEGPLGTLRADRFRGVEPAINPDDRLAFVRHRARVGVREPFCEGHAPGDLLQPRDVLPVLRRGDNRHVVRAPLSGLADLHYVDAIGFPLELEPVLGDLFVVGEEVVIAKVVAKLLQWRRDTRLSLEELCADDSEGDQRGGVVKAGAKKHIHARTPWWGQRPAKLSAPRRARFDSAETLARFLPPILRRHTFGCRDDPPVRIEPSFHPVPPLEQLSVR